MTRSIYVVSAPAGAVKIGIATSAKHRISTLRTASAVPLAVAFLGETEAARQIEVRAHAILKKSRLRGEWFNVSIGDAVRAVLLAASELGYEIRQQPTNQFEPRSRKIGTLIQVRLQRDQLARLDDWRKNQPDFPSRPEAIRQLVEIALKKK